MTTTTQPKPQSTPLERTQGLLDVSVTERGTFRDCRRRWELEVLENLVPKAPAWALEFGTAMHNALEFYYSAPKSMKPAARVAGAYGHVLEWVENTAEFVDGEAYAELMDLRDLGHTMLENYPRYEETTKIDLGTPLAIEGNWLRGRKLKDIKRPEGYPPEAEARWENGRLLVPIVDPRTRKPIHSEAYGITEPPMLSMRIDLLTQRRTPKLGLWVVDHKTAAQAPSDRGLDFDDQITGYCYGVWRWTGQIPRGAIYNVLIKNAPKPPRILSKGDLSTAKDQLCTPDAYREALKEHGLIMPGSKRIATDKHAECLDALLARGWDPFYIRHEALRNEAELRNFERRVYGEYLDMLVARRVDHARYPNPSVRRCPSCSVKQICQAMEDGSDVQSVIEHQFELGEDRKA